MGEGKTPKHSDSFQVVAATADPVLEKRYAEARQRWAHYTATLEEAPAPLNVDIEISSLCNLDCVMCERALMRRKHMNMSMEMFRAVVDECQAMGVDQVKLNLWGESLMNPLFLDMVHYAKANSDLILQFNTNANLLTPEVSRGLVEAGLDKMTVSLDGMRAETYEKIRRKGRFETVWANVHGLLEAKAAAGARLPLLTLQIIQTPDTLDQIDEFVAYWTGKADYVSVTNISAVDNDAILEHSVRESRRTAERVPCAMLWQRLSVFADGTVTVCCSDCEGVLALGKVGEAPLLDMWRGAKLKALRKRHRAGNLKGLICDHCTSTFRYED